MPPNRPLILFWTRWFKKAVDLDAIPRCDFPVEWTNDRSRLAEAAAVIFHVPNFKEIADARKYPGQLWVAWSMESIVNYPALADPVFMRHFDLTMTYESGSDVWTPYLPEAGWWEAARKPVAPPKMEAAPAVHFQSSSFNKSGRDTLLAELSQHIGVDRYGKFNSNRHVEGPDLGPQTKLETIGRYRFCLALENSIAPDYVTEKMFDPLAAGTVPVYLGAPNGADFVPENCYIDAASFDTPRELADYLRHLIETPLEYEAYFAWRSKPLPERLLVQLERAARPPKVRLAALVHERLAARAAQPSGRPYSPFGYAAFLSTRLSRWRGRFRAG
ncbi:glycosyltransferase family 10 domain-containing protein [Mesorhizobium sp. RIZ17]|uniref:glycosyltransferase family 10 fucosyltransferase n=1 Tax=Mesorhizobium sp. RIZ17 TaxID=3132743 RepID=UPI003DA84140